MLKMHTRLVLPTPQASVDRQAWLRWVGSEDRPVEIQAGRMCGLTLAGEWPRGMGTHSPFQADPQACAIGSSWSTSALFPGSVQVLWKQAKESTCSEQESIHRMDKDKTPYLVCSPKRVAGPPGSNHISIIPPTESA